MEIKGESGLITRMGKWLENMNISVCAQEQCVKMDPQVMQLVGGLVPGMKVLLLGNIHLKGKELNKKLLTQY